MRTSIQYLLICLIFACISCRQTSFVISKNEILSTAIILPDSASSIQQFSAEELRKHIKVIFDENIAIVTAKYKDQYKRHIFLGIRPKQFIRELKPEEAVYVIEGKSIYLFGDDEINTAYSEDDPGEFKDRKTSEVLNLAYNRTGTLFAVYAFLENEAGITWIKPGDDGIFFVKKSSLVLPVKEVSWAPRLIQRNIRISDYAHTKYTPQEFDLPLEESVKKEQDLFIWMRRMRIRLNDGINTWFLEWALLYRLTERIDEFYSPEDFDINWNMLFQQQYYQMKDHIGTRFLGFLPVDLNTNDL